VPKSRGREELSVLIGMEVLAEGVAFDSHDLRKLPFRPSHVTRVVNSLMNSRVLTRVGARKYLLTEEFQSLLKGEILAKTPRSGIIQFPAMTVFDICGIEQWNEQEVDRFARMLKEHWHSLNAK
jgi:hypothetical protein